MDKVRLVQVGTKIRITPLGYLGASFDAYRTACQKGGARYNHDFKCNEVLLDAFATLTDSLRQAGFALDITPELAATIQARAHAAKDDVIAASARALAIDTALKAKGLSLFAFQHVGVSWLAPRTCALLLDEMGLGKTIQALLAAPANAPVLVICPAVAKGVWKREAAKWRSDLKVKVLQGRGSFRWPEPGELLITNYDILPDAPPKAPAGVVVLGDEVHQLKSSKAIRTKRCKAVTSAARDAGGRTWGLTATPLLNRPQELWTILSVFGLEREIFGSWPRFVALFNGWQNKWGGYEWGAPDPQVGDLLRRATLRRLRTEVLKDLPKKTRSVLVAELDSKTKKACDKALAALAKVGVNLEAMLDKAATSAGGVAFEAMSAARAALAAAKVETLLNVVDSFEEQDEPVVVFSAHVAPLEALAKREGWALITGATPAEERTVIEDKFQKGELKGIAASIKAGGVAITLTRACHAVFLDLEWTPALNAQAEDRICRIGQTRPVQILRIVADHALDERVMELLGEKQAMIDASVELSNLEDGDRPADLSRALARAVSHS
jgi:SNF2 family DNA or RNA helicase